MNDYTHWKDAFTIKIMNFIYLL